MTFVVDKVNESAAWEALGAANYSRRVAIRVTLADGTQKRMITDSIGQAVGGHYYHPVPFIQYSNFASGQGTAADVLTIRLSAASMVAAALGDSLANSIVADLVGVQLRDRPVQVSYIVLDVNTAEPIGLIPVFVGFADNGRMINEEDGRVYELRVASYRAYAEKRPKWVYGDDHHRQLFPGDGFFKHHADAVNRGLQIPWNTTTGGGSSGGGGGGITTPFSPRTNLF